MAKRSSRQLVREFMNHKRYEQYYQSAVRILELNRYRLGEADSTPGGVRYRTVDGVPLTDDEVFTLAWGREVVRQIGLLAA